jgi:transposase
MVRDNRHDSGYICGAICPILLPLPPYSPELNPMEKVWDYLRQDKLCAIVWNSYDEIIEACKAAWNWLIADPDRIRSIGSRTWATVNV